MNFKLVYGNHGRNPFHIMDTLLLLRLSLEAAGHKADLSEQIVAGTTNIIVECFNAEHVQQLALAKRTQGTDLIIVATEFLTGHTFNNFENKSRSKEHTTASHYSDNGYWSARFGAFMDAQLMARSIWHLSETQVDPFKTLVRHTNVQYLPHGYVEGFERVKHKRPEHKDIDAIFTGHLTDHRLGIIQKLQHHHINAVASQPLNFPQREDLVARSKIALNLKQSHDWKHPSNSRFHYHLSNSSLLLSEYCEISCDLTPYIEQASTDELFTTCRELLVENKWQSRAKFQTERFISECPMLPLMENLLDSTYSTNQ